MEWEKMTFNRNEYMKEYYQRNKEHKKENFLPCAQPWASVHINVEGTVFPCLAVPMGNIQNKNIRDIIFDEEFKRVIINDNKI